MSPQTVLFFSRDPGPTNVLIAVHEALIDPEIRARSSDEFQRFSEALTQGETPEFVIYGKGRALDSWRLEGLEARDLNDHTALETLLRDHGVTALITGTSDIDDNTDCALWRAAHTLGLTSHVFIDHRSNLERRFKDGDGSQVYPDAVYVPDTGYGDALIGGGLPPERLHVIGDLQFARMGRMGERVSPAEVSALRELWRADAGQQIVLFASECTAEMAALGRPSPYSEFATLEQLIADLHAHLPIDGRRTCAEPSLLVIRPHPRDTDGKYDVYAAREGSPRVVVSGDGTPA